MAAWVRPPCNTELTDGLYVFSCFAVPCSMILYQHVKCSGPIPRERATCTAHTVPTKQGARRALNQDQVKFFSEVGLELGVGGGNSALLKNNLGKLLLLNPDFFFLASAGQRYDSLRTGRALLQVQIQYERQCS
jgi:hypothetical protein